MIDLWRPDAGGMFRLALLVCAVAGLSAAEVRLHDGQVVDGDIVAEDGDVVRVRIAQAGMVAERLIPRSAIAAIDRSPSPRQQGAEALRREAAAAAPDDAAAWSRLALRAQQIGDPAQARAWAARAVALDRHQAQAQRLLGRDLVNGVWMRPHEAAAAQGRVWHDGAWLSYAEREVRRQEERAAAERQRAYLASLAQQRREQAAARAAAAPEPYLPRVDSYVFRPGARVVWLSNCAPGPWAPAPTPVSMLSATGGWGGVSWRLNLNW